MTQKEFKREGWLKHFLQYDEAELTTIVILVESLLETDCWEPTVSWCMRQVELAKEDEFEEPRMTDEGSEDQTLH